MIKKEAESQDYDSIDEKEFKKYEKINLGVGKKEDTKEKSFSNELKFYLDPDINFYEKDKQP